LRENREAFILADELGFEGYVGEHATDLAENITSSSLFVATLVGHVKSMRLGTGTVCREEIFGPVCHIEPFDTEEEAIARDNDTDYGLCASIWSQNLSQEESSTLQVGG
jgi:acyl-CoA reductase-like NAD-dependent aldehyde dehydrogenase